MQWRVSSARLVYYGYCRSGTGVAYYGALYGASDAPSVMHFANAAWSAKVLAAFGVKVSIMPCGPIIASDFTADPAALLVRSAPDAAA